MGVDHGEKGAERVNLKHDGTVETAVCVVTSQGKMGAARTHTQITLQYKLINTPTVTFLLLSHSAPTTAFPSVLALSSGTELQNLE